MNEVDAPDMIGILGAQANDRAVLVVEPLSLLMTPWQPSGLGL